MIAELEQRKLGVWRRKEGRLWLIYEGVRDAFWTTVQSVGFIKLKKCGADREKRPYTVSKERTDDWSRTVQWSAVQHSALIFLP